MYTYRHNTYFGYITSTRPSVFPRSLEKKHTLLKRKKTAENNPAKTTGFWSKRLPYPRPHRLMLPESLVTIEAGSPHDGRFFFGDSMGESGTSNMQLVGVPSRGFHRDRTNSCYFLIQGHPWKWYHYICQKESFTLPFFPVALKNYLKFQNLNLDLHMYMYISCWEKKFQ